MQKHFFVTSVPRSALSNISSGNYHFKTLAEAEEFAKRRVAERASRRERDGYSSDGGYVEVIYDAVALAEAPIPPIEVKKFEAAK